MTEKIKDGLHFSLNTQNISVENNSFLTRKADSIILSCQFSDLNCNISFIDNPDSYHLEFRFHHDYLKSFSPDFDLNQYPENQQHDICCNTQMILHDIINCNLQGAFRNMFLESKALSLLLCFQKCNAISSINCSSCKFLSKPIEKEKIFKAKEIILNSLNNPPTIPELSLLIGINQCYLKKGFKELFGTTVYDFVQEQRMLKAKLLLSTTGFTVTQVADKIGFSSASNFSTAFKKFAGVFPSEFQQN